MMSIKKILTIFFFVSIKIFPQNSFSQSESLKIDSLIKKDQWDLVHLKLLNENLKFKRISNYKLQYHLLIKLDSATVLYKQGKYSEAKKAVLSSINQVELNKNSLIPSHYNGLKHIGITRLFYIEKRLGDISQGLKYINLFSRDMNPIYKKKQLIFYAVAYTELGNYNKGIELLNTHLKDILSDEKKLLYSGVPRIEEIAATYNTKGDTFVKWYKDSGNKEKLDSAQCNYEKAAKLMKSNLDLAPYSRALLISRFANMRLLKRQYKHSLSLYNICERDSILMSKSFSRETVWLGKAEIYTFLKKPDSAFYYLNKLYREKLPIKCTYENKLKIYYLLSLNYENSSDNANAYKFAKLSLSEIGKKQIKDISGNNFLGRYEQLEIKSISEETIKENKKNTFLFIVITLLISTFFILYLAYNYYKRKKKFFTEFQRDMKERGVFPIETFTIEKSKKSTVVEDKVVNRILSNLDLLESKKVFLSKNFKLTSMAKQLNTNTAYLSKILNEYKGISFSEYVNDLRINYVLKELEQNTIFRKYTIQTISEEIGYKSPTTFIKAFKSRTEMTPSQYIKKLNSL